MANLLLNALPTKIKIDGKEFDIVTDFRAGITFETMVEKGDIDIYKLLQIYFPSGTPENITEATDKVIWFYKCGEEGKKDATTSKNTKPGYSFTQDSAVIYADFLRYYDMDLTTCELHWWKFRELLFALPVESAFKERIYYRTCDLKGLPKKEQKRIRAIREEIKIETSKKGGKLTLEQRNKQMLDYVNKRFNDTRG